MSRDWSPEARRRQAQRLRAVLAAMTPEQKAERERKRQASRVARRTTANQSTGAATQKDEMRGAGAGPASAHQHAEPAVRDRREVGGACGPEPPSPSSPSMPTCPLLGALLGQIVTTIAAQSRPVTALPSFDRLEQEALDCAVRLAEAPGSNPLAWFAAYAAFYQTAIELAAQRRRRVT